MTICFTFIASSTLAYFTTERTAHNVITSGGVDIKLVETALDGHSNEQSVISTIKPGSKYNKIVQVKNTGNKDAWVRLKISSEIKTSDGRVLPEKNENAYSILDFELENAWTLGADGYYYYQNPLPADESTSNLFEHASFSKTMGNEYQNANVSLKISAQAVQTANNGPSISDATGWPGD
ncbi:MAG: hypothetical protein Q4E22_05660 [Coriobacteriia bacterium]|nr:hypothetical protein [Coriobacteriia bacterium]